jgi:formate-nitrite transporter family protein
MAEGQNTNEKPLKSNLDVLDQEIAQAVEELNRPARGLLMSGLLAGFGVGVSLLLLAAIKAGGEGALPELLVSMLAANGYALGFIIVIMANTDLFTEYTTIAILPVLTRDASARALARLWVLVYVSNLVGGAIFAWMAVAVASPIGGIPQEIFGEIARELVQHSGWLILGSALLAGWLMGLLSWLVTAARETISQIFFIWIIGFTIGFVPLHHSVVGTVEVVAGMLTGAVAWLDFGRFLLWTTIGNAIGGVVFALLIRYSVLIGGGKPDESSR